MDIEELKSLQEKIIRKDKRYTVLGMIIITILIVISLLFFISAKLELIFLAQLLLFEFIMSVAMLVFIKTAANGKDIQRFKEEFKNTFVLNTLKRFFGNIEYKFEEGFSKQYIKNLGMLDTGDIFSSNDYIHGYYKNIDFEQSDISVKEKHTEVDDDGKTTTVYETIFSGRLMVFDFNKCFKNNIQVVSRYFGAFTFSWGKNISKVKMEDAEFNQQFSVYAESNHEAFYILTPHFMEKLKNITEKLNCGVMYGFSDSKLYIAVDNRIDSFEYNVFKPINEEEIEKEILKDIKVITDFVDELNLDNDLFRKEV